MKMNNISTSLRGLFRGGASLATFLWIAASFAPDAKAQVIAGGSDADKVPVVSYSQPRSKVIAGLQVVGNKSYDETVVRNVSGLKVGQRIEIPGEETTQAVKNYLRNGLFTDVSLVADKMEGDSVWISIHITERPRLSRMDINGTTKSEAKDLREGKLLALQEGTHITPNLIDRAKIEIKRFYDEKGFSDAGVEATTIEDVNRPGYVVLIFNVEKNAKIRIANINFFGNHNVSDFKLRQAMKKTNELFSLAKHPWNSFLEIFSTKNFVEKEYKNDLKNILDKYHEEGFRDAEILSDTIYKVKNNRINIDIHISEGQRYFIKDINFVGNTKYSTADLQRLLGIKPGDVYDQKKLQDRLTVEEDAVSNLYANNGYLFAYMVPVETEVKGDSVALDIRIHEGKPATINKVAINGNDVLYEEVVRRELYTKPGMLYNKEYIMNSMRLIANTGHFDQEKIVPDIIPNEKSGTVDIAWNLVPKSNDQVQLSIGWSATGLVGMAGVTFNNFSMRNLFKPKTYEGYIPIPRGDGQTLSLNAQTNARYYQNYSITFTDPWFGRKRPNYFSVQAYYSRQTDINRNFYNSQMQQMPYYSPYGYGYGSPYGYGGYGYGGYGYGGYGYGGYGYDPYGSQMYAEQLSSLYESAFDPDKTLDILGASVSYGKRLSWPDDRFQFSVTLGYQMYRMKNWNMYYYNFGMENGTAHDINLSLTLSRSSIDNPIYTRKGSEFTLNAKSTLPYSLWDGIDYSDPNLSDQVRNKFIEYYQISGKGRFFIPLMDPASTQRTPVLMANLEAGIIGAFDPNKRSPFGTYYMGGDGMSSYIGYMNQMIGLRGYRNGSISGASGQGAYTYAKAYMELRYPVLFEGQTTIWALGFVEAGNAWYNVRDFNPFRLKRSAGLGVRIMLPMVGLMGIDWGYGFDSPDGTSQIGGSNVHFVLGQQF